MKVTTIFLRPTYDPNDFIKQVLDSCCYYFDLNKDSKYDGLRCDKGKYMIEIHEKKCLLGKKQKLSYLKIILEFDKEIMIIETKGKRIKRIYSKLKR